MFGASDQCGYTLNINQGKTHRARKYKLDKFNKSYLSRKGYLLTK